MMIIYGQLYVKIMKTNRVARIVRNNKYLRIITVKSRIYKSIIRPMLIYEAEARSETYSSSDQYENFKANC